MFMDVGESCFSEFGEGCGLGLQIRAHIIAFPVLRMRKREKRKGAVELALGTWIRLKAGALEK